MDEKICDFLEKGIPSISFDMQKEKDPANCADGIDCFTKYILKLIEREELSELEKSFSIAEHLLSEGSDKIKSMLTIQFMTCIYPLMRGGKPYAIELRSMLKGDMLAHFKYSLIMDEDDLSGIP